MAETCLPAANPADEIYPEMGISPAVLAYSQSVLSDLRERFEAIDRTAEYNQLKVLKAFQKNRIGSDHFNGSQGYGYQDAGRDDLEKVFADTFHTESALVRSQITCGTHALSVALAGCLRPGDELVSVSGRPYDTLEEIIGIRPSRGSLREFGITYRQVELTPDGNFDFKAIREALGPHTRMAAIQRSRGYLTRPSLRVAQIAEVIDYIHSIRPDILIMTDNCYGEFVETKEPSDFGADMIVGSLIKNPGGGLAPMGGYIAGKEECIENCAVRLNAPGLGRETGANPHGYRDYYQGFFLAPTVTASALKCAIFSAALYENLGFSVSPSSRDERTDIIQALVLGSPEALIAFCRGIQAASPVDSYVTPEPWPMPGYSSDVIMAAGAFIQGSSIELSADGPLREPYAAYLQGGLTWPHGRFGITMSLQKLYEKGLVNLP